MHAKFGGLLFKYSLNSNHYSLRSLQKTRFDYLLTLAEPKASKNYIKHSHKGPLQDHTKVPFFFPGIPLILSCKIFRLSHKM